MRLDRKSISQANAEALDRRSRTYADEHAASWTFKMERGRPPRLGDLVRDLRRAYGEEVPSRIHSRDTDAGGDPAWSPEFTRFLCGSDFNTDRRDDGTTEVYTTPFRAALSAMSKSAHEGTRRRASIVFRIVVGGSDPVEAAMVEGAPEWDASACAQRACELFWHRFSDIRLDLRRTETAA